MTPTQDEFLYTVQQIGIPEDAIYLFAIPGTSTTLIQGIAVSVFSKISETSTTSVDISDVLEQVTRINFQFAGEDVILDVTDRSKYQDEVGRYFFYFQVEPYTFNSVLTQTEVSDIRINFYPYVKGQSFYNSEYNAIQNSINEQERSTFLQIADRDTLGIHPNNLDAILIGIATKAQIPDSNYTDTGLIRSRYEGVKSTDNNYGGIPSSLIGTTFLGSYHPESLTAEDILNKTVDERVEVTYLHTQNSRFPSFIYNPSRVKIALPLPPITQTTSEIKYDSYPLNSPISKNSLLLITGSVGEEVVRVYDYNVNTKIIKIKRGVGDTEPKYFSTYTIYPIYDNRIYQLTGNKLNSVESGKILVSNTNTILKLDEFGVVYGQEN